MTVCIVIISIIRLDYGTKLESDIINERPWQQ